MADLRAQSFFTQRYPVTDRTKVMLRKGLGSRLESVKFGLDLLTQLKPSMGALERNVQMARSVRILSISVLLAASACTVQPGGSTQLDSGVDDSEVAVDSGTGAATPPKNALNFVPTNAPNVVADGTSNIQITGNCTFDTDAGTADCLYDNDYRFQKITQADADQTEVGVFVIGSLTVGADAVVWIKGSRPFVLVTSGAMTIKGMLLATPGVETNRSNGGGFSSPLSGATDHKGKGPGGGGAPAGTTGGGGGAYCGKGGGTNGGAPYGNPVISPLLGGSSGGMGGDMAGGGGGAIQLVSATSITLTSQAKINVGGGGGVLFGDGGGSGGAVMLEAPVVTMGGTVAANGGSGSANSLGSNTSGFSGTADSTPAPGATGNGNPGGNGSAGTVIDGTAGTYNDSSGTIAGLGNYGGGSGAGAGRIRINTTTGQATITGTLSPASTTSCVSQGKLKTK
jgi:hypothetical protein